MEGLIGKKAGMTHIFSEAGNEIPVTVLEVGPCPVIQLKTPEKDGYAAAQLAFGAFTKKDKRKMRKPQRAAFENVNVKSHRHLREFKLVGPAEESPKVGDVIEVDIFNSTDFVSVTAVSKGRGFTGVIKRHGYSGAPMSHGAHEQFRHPGSMGMCVQPGRILPGKKLPGWHGGASVKALNLEVVKMYPERNILLVKGSVPGPNGGLVVVEKCYRKKKQAPPEPKVEKKRKR